MARLRSWLPWGLLFHIAILFMIAWWIEDCFLYYIDWNQFALLRGVDTLLVRAHVNEFLAFVSQFLADVVHHIATLIGAACALIQSAYGAIPEGWRAYSAMHFVAWCGGSIVATFNAAAVYDCWLGFRWFLGKLFKVLIALNGGFWINNSMRRLSRGLGNVITYPARFYSDRTEEDTHAEDFPPVAEPDPDEVAPPRTNRDGRTRRREYVQFFQGHVERIGIILAGGGATGAYQAGALKAIHEFLRDYNALHKVKMIAGTSIGAWNAMFWIADMIDSEDDQQSGLESWWKNLRYRSLVEFPWLYIPFWSGSLLRSTPWRASFERLFRRKLDAAFGETAPTHFYLTRTDVNEVALKYATNWTGIGDRLDKLGKDKDDDYRFFEVIGAGDHALEQTADAVFASMNLPPVFPYAKIGDAVFEDGGVIEDLPFRFGAPIEDCDLLFVLPLNTTFQKHDAPKQTLIKHVQRVAEVRRGVLETHALKTADTINRFAQRMERLDFGVTTMANAMPPEGVAAEALGGVREEIAEFNTEYKLLYIFTVCPSGTLELGTFDFWKRRAVQDAFDLMYLQTKRELQNRLFEDVEPEDPHVVFIDAEVPDYNALPKPTHKRPSEL
jgi:predicted acylesterase/phospholipase RssA